MALTAAHALSRGLARTVSAAVQGGVAGPRMATAGQVTTGLHASWGMCGSGRPASAR